MSSDLTLKQLDPLAIVGNLVEGPIRRLLESVVQQHLEDDAALRRAGQVGTADSLLQLWSLYLTLLQKAADQDVPEWMKTQTIGRMIEAYRQTCHFIMSVRP